jgi:hypothetical protein
MLTAVCGTHPVFSGNWKVNLDVGKEAVVLDVLLIRV